MAVEKVVIQLLVALLCLAILRVIVYLIVWPSMCNTAQSVSGFENCDGDCQGPRLGTCEPSCSISCRAEYSARENFSCRSGRAEGFSPDSRVYAAPGSGGYTSACRRSAETPLARAADNESAALSAVNGGATL